jgi:PHD/YefM family antitoxin component YafN of YafNO toxin-antitoxin module
MKQKLKNNEKTVLLKYVGKLEMKNVKEDATQDQILEAICQFLITDEGKKMAAYSLSEKTYEQMYLNRKKGPQPLESSSNISTCAKTTAV